MNNTNYIFSYINPDTDGIACSIALSFLLKKSKKKEYIPTVIGRIGYETQYVLKELNLHFPQIINELPDSISSIVLVDTHHVLQLPSKFPMEKVCLIIDHHTNGDDDQFPNAIIDNRNIGAAASIVAERFFEAELYDEKMLKLLAMAIVSNTLNFNAPSTTSFDKRMYDRITKIYPISDETILLMLNKRSCTIIDDMENAVSSDVKCVESAYGKICISQLEVYNLIKLIDYKEVLRLLKKMEKNKGIICIFNGVDILDKKTIVMCGSDKGRIILQQLFNLSFYSYYEIIDRILLRKTDYFPKLSFLS